MTPALATHHLPVLRGFIMPHTKGNDCLNEFRVLELSLTCNLDELARILNRELNPIRQMQQALFAADMMAQQTERNGAALSKDQVLFHICKAMTEQATAEITEFANDVIKESDVKNILLVSKDNEIKQLEDALVLLQKDYEFQCSKMSDKGYSGVPKCTAKNKPRKRKAKGGRNEVA
jgi:predicted ribonuclease YlaK